MSSPGRAALLARHRSPCLITGLRNNGVMYFMQLVELDPARDLERSYMLLLRFKIFPGTDIIPPGQQEWQ